MVKKVISHPLVTRFIVNRFHFGRVADFVAERYLRTYLNIDERYFRLLYCLEQTKDLKGDVVELGVGSGRSLIYAATWLKNAGSTKHYYGYDTFSGFPSVREEDKVGLSVDRLQRVKVGVYGIYDRARMEKWIRRLGLDNVKLVEGDFTKTLQQVKPERVSFLYIDCDLYDGYKAGLEELYDRMAPGGIILFDEYERIDEWPGARKAVDEFFADKVEKPQKLPCSESYYVRRQAESNGAAQRVAGAAAGDEQSRQEAPAST